MDAQCLAWLYEWRHPLLDIAMRIVTWAGSVIVLLPLACAIGWRMAAERGWRQRAFLPAVVLGAALLVRAVKWIIGRERPELYASLITLPADASFPSAHAWQSAAFVVAWLSIAHAWKRPGWVVAGTAAVLLVGVSRLYLQVHYPSDVLAGMLAGGLWAWALRRLPPWRAG